MYLHANMTPTVLGPNAPCTIEKKATAGRFHCRRQIELTNTELSYFMYLHANMPPTVLGPKAPCTIEKKATEGRFNVRSWSAYYST